MILSKLYRRDWSEWVSSFRMFLEWQIPLMRVKSIKNSSWKSYIILKPISMNRCSQRCSMPLIHHWMDLFLRNNFCSFQLRMEDPPTLKKSGNSRGKQKVNWGIWFKRNTGQLIISYKNSQNHSQSVPSKRKWESWVSQKIKLCWWWKLLTLQCKERSITRHFHL